MSRQQIISLWLFTCAFMVVMMTGIGAVTRLTESGLSITEWKVVSGTLPPLTDTAWQEAFDKYQTTPEFTQKHHWMNLADFKGIFFWEWFHRLWGRTIGLVFALPFLFFWKKGWIEKSDRYKYTGLLLLGAAQGGLGWFMVKSGLVDRPSVSHFRLAAHLAMALTIYGALVLAALDVRKTKFMMPLPATCGIIKHGVVSLLLVAITIVWGAFVAGLHAGHIYNTFPNMGAGLIPPELGSAPFLTDAVPVQFTHRALAMITGIVTIAYGLRFLRLHKNIALITIGFMALQIILGIATLLSKVWIPLAVAHQINATFLLAILLTSLYAAFVSRRASNDA